MEPKMGAERPRPQVSGADGYEAVNVRRLRPLRVLLAMRDRRFMRVTCFLLERRGYDVTQEGSAGIVQAASKFRADVVVFEGELSRGSSARTLAALAALDQPPGVVTITADGDTNGAAGAAVIRKWTSVEDLAREIDAAALRRGAQLEERRSGS
jgi:CheY-like chemotaxis protein